MDKRGTYVILGMIVVALGVMFFVSWFNKSSEETLTPPATDDTSWQTATATPTEDALPVSEKTVITAKHAYRAGEHIVAGELPLPTPCHILETGITATTTTFAIIGFSSSVKSGEVCAQVITPARFKVRWKGEASARLSATLNGVPVTLNLIPAGPNEDLDNFELYIKG